MKTDRALQAIRYQRGSLSILDQLKLPEQSVYITINTASDAWKAIRGMSIRGAPAIAVCGVLSVAVELHNSRLTYEFISDVRTFVSKKLQYLVTARPTAVNMTEATRTFIDCFDDLEKNEKEVIPFIDGLLGIMEAFLARDLADNRSIGRHGASVIQQSWPDEEKFTILTHCNTGSLATVGFGTALGVIRQLNAMDLLECAYFTETRPYNQGSRLTAFELIHDDIPHTMICDSMAGLLMRSKNIHAVVVGADRVTANGDTANKIGTYQLAVLARHHKIPFYVAAPTTSIDLNKKTGDEIVIEERPAHEMTSIKGTRIAAEGVKVWNPSFDVTPAELITGIITEHGVYEPDKLEEELSSLQSIADSTSS